MPPKKSAKTFIKPPNHILESLKKKASEVAEPVDATELPKETKHSKSKTEMSATAADVPNITETKEVKGDAPSLSKKAMESTVDASWSNFPAEEKLVKAANQKRSNNDLRGAISLYIQVYNKFDKLCQISAKRLSIKIVSKIANTYIDLQEFEEAKGALEKAIEVQTTLAILLYNESKVAMENGDISRAETFISEAVGLFKLSKISEENLAKYIEILQAASKVFLTAKKFKKALECCNKVIEHDSGQSSHYARRSEIYSNFIQLMGEDSDLLRSVDDDYDLADIVVDSSMTKNFCSFKGKNCYKSLEQAFKLSLNNASINTDSFRIFINSGVYDWPLKSTLEEFLVNLGDKSTSSLRITGSKNVVFLPNANEKEDSMQINGFSKGKEKIFFKNISFGERKSSVRNRCQRGFLVTKPTKTIVLYFEKRVKVDFDSCLFSNVKIEARNSPHKSDRSSLTFDFCHFKNEDCANFELSSASWWKVSVSNCVVKQDDAKKGFVARVGCHFSLSNTQLAVDSYNSGNKLLVIGETANFMATGCHFGSSILKEVKCVTMDESCLPLSEDNVIKMWNADVIKKPWNDIHHKPYDIRILNGAKCNIEKSCLAWGIQVNSSDATIKQCIISNIHFGRAKKVAAAVALEKHGQMSVISNTFKQFSLGILISMGAEPLIDKNKFLEGSFSAILVQQQSKPLIRRNSFKEGDDLGQMCAILYLPEFSSGSIEHNTFQDFSFQPIFIFQENKVEVIHNSYVDIDYMRNAIHPSPAYPWSMFTVQDRLIELAFQSTYEDIFHDKMKDIYRYNVIAKIGCSMMEHRWPNDDIKVFWKTDYGTKRRKQNLDCQKHKTIASKFSNCTACDSEYETAQTSSESEEESDEDYSESDDESLLESMEHIQLYTDQGKVLPWSMIQRKKDIKKKREKRNAEKATKEKVKKERRDKREKRQMEKRLTKETYIAVLGGAQLKECFSCGKIKIKVQNCSQCKLVYFCDIVCQKASWPTHKVLCKLISV